MSETQDNASVPVLFVLPTLGMGGSERVVLNLCRHLRQSRFSPVVAAFRGGPLEQEMVNIAVPVHVLKRCGGVDLRLVWKLIRLIRRYRIRIVNSHHFVSLFYSFWATRWTGISLLHTEHSRWEMENLSTFWNRWFRFFLTRVELISAVSQAAFDHLRHAYGVSSTRVVLVLNGVDANVFTVANADSVTRESLALTADETVVATVGNFRREKNQKLLIQALAVLDGVNRPVRVVFVGDGPCREELEKLAAELGVEQHVLFLGTRSDTARLYRIFDIYCLTSHYEGLPLTLLEAMASGIPVIGTDVLGIREVVKHNENGMLVPEGDPKALAQAIRLLLEDPVLRNTMATQGRKFVHENFSVSAFLRGYEKLFDGLADRALAAPSRS